jgi:hypothetical protein
MMHDASISRRKERKEGRKAPAKRREETDLCYSERKRSSKKVEKFTTHRIREVGFPDESVCDKRRNKKRIRWNLRSTDSGSLRSNKGISSSSPRIDRSSHGPMWWLCTHEVVQTRNLTTQGGVGVWGERFKMNLRWIDEWNGGLLILRFKNSHDDPRVVQALTTDMKFTAQIHVKVGRGRIGVA